MLYVFVLAFCFSLPLIFTLVAASISHFTVHFHRPAIKFSCFSSKSSNEILFLCFLLPFVLKGVIDWTKIRPVRPGKVVLLKSWNSFFETFLVGPNRSIEFRSEFSGNSGWMDHASGPEYVSHLKVRSPWLLSRDTATATTLDFSLGFVMCKRELRRLRMFQLFHEPNCHLLTAVI